LIPFSATGLNKL